MGVPPFLDDGVELRRGSKEETALDYTAGDLYEAVGCEQMADLASHASIDEESDDHLAVIEEHLMEPSLEAKKSSMELQERRPR